ncbi:MAG: hypothetical protein AAGD04_08230 [Pseudomonadota bacterium]
MILNLAIFFPFSMAILACLCFVILDLGRRMEDCPVTGQAAPPAAIAIAVAFVAIGFGGVGLGAAALIALQDFGLVGVFGLLGFMSLCLGLGFSNAVAHLKMVLADSAKAQLELGLEQPS